ncbi:hypothetical protein SFC79_11340 [Nocardioides sp. S-58]|uniref:Uncharacterized protein n=1 Tax=Nocardioides renjunii TaxID=3095075 RepID=A0ABU5KBX6_9ACTN|nr:hypothetical protein [Nocardioides sp. S-58]MDZ5662359.1 hypothetical protein [Nocardioides sp. S-58]
MQYAIDETGGAQVELADRRTPPTDEPAMGQQTSSDPLALGSAAPAYLVVKNLVIKMNGR